MRFLEIHLEVPQVPTYTFPSSLSISPCFDHRFNLFCHKKNLTSQKKASMEPTRQPTTGPQHQVGLGRRFAAPKKPALTLQRLVVWPNGMHSPSPSNFFFGDIPPEKNMPILVLWPFWGKMRPILAFQTQYEKFGPQLSFVLPQGKNFQPQIYFVLQTFQKKASMGPTGPQPTAPSWPGRN